MTNRYRVITNVEWFFIDKHLANTGRFEAIRFWFLLFDKNVCKNTINKIEKSFKQTF